MNKEVQNNGNGNSGMSDKKITLHVMIEGGRTFTGEFVVKQKLQVIVNKTMEHFNLNDADKRKLTRGDNTELTDWQLTIEEVGLTDGETLKFFLKQPPKPGDPKKFA